MGQYYRSYENYPFQHLRTPFVLILYHSMHSWVFIFLAFSHKKEDPPVNGPSFTSHCFSIFVTNSFTVCCSIRFTNRLSVVFVLALLIDLLMVLLLTATINQF